MIFFSLERPTFRFSDGESWYFEEVVLKIDSDEDSLSLDHEPTSHKHSLCGSLWRLPRNPDGAFSAEDNGRHVP